MTRYIGALRQGAQCNLFRAGVRSRLPIRLTYYVKRCNLTK